MSTHALFCWIKTFIIIDIKGKNNIDVITTFSNVSPLHIKWTSGPKTYLLLITTITKLNTGAPFLVYGLELDTMKYLLCKSYVSWPLEALCDINVQSIPHKYERYLLVYSFIWRVS